MSETSTPLRIEIWSDVICPWCYIGKTRFDQAVERLGDEIDLEVTYRAYQLDPTARPGVTEPVTEAYSPQVRRTRAGCAGDLPGHCSSR